MGKVGAGEEERWPSPHAMVACWERGPLACILMDGTGVHRCQRWCCGARSAALTFPPAPFLSRSAGEEGGDGIPSPSPSCPAAPLRGDGSSSPSPLVPCRSSTGRWDPLTLALVPCRQRQGEGGGWRKRMMATSSRHGCMGTVCSR